MQCEDSSLIMRFIHGGILSVNVVHLGYKCVIIYNCLTSWTQSYLVELLLSQSTPDIHIKLGLHKQKQFTPIEASECWVTACGISCQQALETALYCWPSLRKHCTNSTFIKYCFKFILAYMFYIL